MDDPRILTDDESYERRSQQAASIGPRTISLCAEPGCPRAAAWGPWCGDHRPAAGPRIGVAHDLTGDQYDAIRAEVNAKAAPLFLLAMDFILRKQLANLGVELPAPVVAIARDEPA